ncbi:peptide/nickel transport system substrate-binding protein [Thermopolyspora flexuosa]|uniref:Peptide/nickel transport system substrate-binding protein n=1 Tax=Thermopolyspora flexuosa TaxID=103836 RepID=A0A543J1N3_9ACTN|nr:peptide/nickel transport system substrate-binding protein [Thermopolyspora flexuosa]
MRRKTQRIAVLLAALLGVAACSNQGASTTGSSAAVESPRQGGEITVLEDSAFAGSWPTGLDPASNTTGGANIAMMQAIYGGLFLVRANDDGSNARVEPHQAESYELLDGGKTVKIKIRDGIKFSDGTPLDAEAVRFNFERNLNANCTCKPTWPLAEKDPITVEEPNTVVLRFSEPYGAVINSFPVSNVNWIVSPTALKEMGEEKFRVTPVGAGPFKVVSNKLSSELVLERNPNYFKQGLPYLDKLTFKSIGGDQAAYTALLSGQAHAYEGMNTVPLLEQAEANDKLTVTLQPPTSPYVIQLNTQIEPFNDKKAREAIYYATNFQAIADGVFKGKYPVSQSFTASGGLFHKETVPGYRTYDLEKAKQLVQELGGMKIKLGTISNYVAKQVVTALQTQWREAGIEVEIVDHQLATLIKEFQTNKWQAMLQTAGAWDPASGVGVGFRFTSTSPYSGIKDPKIDELVRKASATIDQAERERLYTELGQYISDNAYAPFGLAFAPGNVVVKGVYGPGLTTKIPPLMVNTGVIWDEVWRSQ